ncbi:MAG: type II secretion system protein [Aquificae bacterium]|nr:type II secretion system protein [Aquificota bacterium]
MRGFTLIEVIVSFTLAVLAISVVLWSISGITGSISGRDDVLNRISRASKIFMAEKQRRGKVLNSYRKNPNLSHLNPEICYEKVYEGLTYRACVLTPAGTFGRNKGWRFVYVEEFPFLFPEK